MIMFLVKVSTKLKQSYCISFMDNMLYFLHNCNFEHLTQYLRTHEYHVGLIHLVHGYMYHFVRYSRCFNLVQCVMLSHNENDKFVYMSWCRDSNCVFTFMLENCGKIIHFRFNLDACPMHSPFGFVHLTHQNLSVRGLFWHNSLG